MAVGTGGAKQGGVRMPVRAQWWLLDMRQPGKDGVDDLEKREIVIRHLILELV